MKISFYSSKVFLFLSRKNQKVVLAKNSLFPRVEDRRRNPRNRLARTWSWRRGVREEKDKNKIFNLPRCLFFLRWLKRIACQDSSCNASSHWHCVTRPQKNLKLSRKSWRESRAIFGFYWPGRKGDPHKEGLKLEGCDSYHFVRCGSRRKIRHLK